MRFTQMLCLFFGFLSGCSTSHFEPSPQNIHLSTRLTPIDFPLRSPDLAKHLANTGSRLEEQNPGNFHGFRCGFGHSYFYRPRTAISFRLRGVTESFVPLTGVSKVRLYHVSITPRQHPSNNIPSPFEPLDVGAAKY